MRRRLLVLLAVAPVVLLACRDGAVDVGTEGPTTTGASLGPIPPQGAPEQDRLDAARAHWHASGLEDYEWAYERGCFCLPLAVTVRVEGGVPVAHEIGPVEGGFSDPDQEPEILTMPDLFDLVQEQIDTADSLTVEYDPDNGRVRVLEVDPIENAIDDELQYRVTAFRVATASGVTTTTTGYGERMDPATFSEDYGCGRSFQASDADQTVALHLDLVDPTYEAAPPTAASLPSSEWDARIEVGSDLFSNWCDDVIEPDEPVPEVDEVWPVVAGTIALAGDVSGSPDVSSSVTAHLTGIVAERPDGTRVEVGDLDVTNDHWGGAAG